MFTSLLCWALTLLLIFQMRWQIADAVLLVSNVEESVQNFNVFYTLVSLVFHCNNKRLPFISDCSRVVLSYVRIWTCLSYFILSREEKVTVLFRHEASDYTRTPIFFPNQWTERSLISPVSIPISSKTLRTFLLQSSSSLLVFD